MKRILSILLGIMVLCSTSLALCEENTDLYEVFSYGQSVMGRELYCHRIGDKDASQSFLFVFAIHGFEDAFHQDGRVLTTIANLMIDHYRAKADQLGSYVLYTVPCANPDGQLDGVSQDGFGRCNADGIDINRDFPTEWTRMTTARYQTGTEPFATPEARHLRDLVLTLAPTYGADVHGWINRVYGNRALAQPFLDAFGFTYRKYQSGGKLSQWMDEQTQGAVLIELPDNAAADGFAQDCAQKLITALDVWMAQTRDQVS